MITKKNLTRTGTISVAASIVALGGALAPSASAYGGANHVHLGGTYATKAACQPAADAYKKQVAAAKGELDKYVDNNCHLETKGWTFATHYEGPKTLKGDIASQHSAAMASALVKNNGEFTHYVHTYNFTDMATCKKAHDSVLAKVKAADGKSAQLLRDQKCVDIDGEGTISYSIEYLAKRHAPVYPYEYFESINAKTKTSTNGRVGKSLSSENISFTTKHSEETIQDLFAEASLAWR